MHIISVNIIQISFPIAGVRSKKKLSLDYAHNIASIKKYD